MAGQFTVFTNGQTLVLTAVTNNAGSSVTVYSDSGTSSSVTLPNTISADTVYYTKGEGTLNVTIAQPDGSTLFSGTVESGSLAATAGRVSPQPTGIQVAADVTASAYSDSRGVGQRWVALGDSTDKGSDGAMARGLSWTLFAGLATNERAHLVYNAGVSGNTTTQMLARFDTDVTPYNPNLVTFGSGRNDIGGGGSLSTYQSNIRALVAKTRAIGATPVLRTTAPTTSTEGLTTAAWNHWLRGYAASQGIRLVDFYEVLVDPSTGSYLSAYDSGDHIHPSEAGYAALGARFAADLDPILAPPSIPSVMDSADTANMLQAVNPLFLTTTITSNAPASWSLVDGGSLSSGSIVQSDTSIFGNWYRMTFSSSASDVTLYRSSFVTGVVGRVYAFTGRIRTNLSASGGVFAQCGTGSGTAYAVYNGGTVPYNGRFWITFTAAGTTLNPQIFVKAGTTGTVDVSELAMFDLTTLGLDTFV